MGIILKTYKLDVMETFDETTPVALLTVGQLLSLLNFPKEQTTKSKDFSTNDKLYVYGISGLAKIIGCSKPTAQKLKDSGKISFFQTGRKLVFDVDLVLSELGKNRKG